MSSLSLFSRSSSLLRAGLLMTSRYLSSSPVDIDFSESTNPFKLHKLKEGPPNRATGVTKDELLKMYTDMVVIREMETEARKMYQSKQIRGFCHLYIGQEACSVGMESAITPDDPVITAYRAHGWTYTRGIHPREVLAELTGRRTGCAKGKGGSMHMYAPNFYGGNGIVGAQVPLGAGIGLELKYNGKDDNICVTLYGDGAANQGQLFEAFNMSALWKLPVLFVCENNRYGMGTAVHRASASTDYYTRGDYISGIYVDGMDVLAVREATRWAKEYILREKVPLVMELDTYRYYGHSMSDPGKSYRKSEEVQQFRKEKDAIKIAMSYLTSNNMATADELTSIQKTIQSEMKENVEFALTSAEPDMDQLYTDILVNTQAYPVRGCDPFTWGDSQVKSINI